MKLCVVLMAIALAVNAASGAIMRLRVRVVDADTGAPVSGAEVGVDFCNPPLLWGDESHDVSRYGFSDKDGWFSSTGRSSNGRCDLTVRVPDEYYDGYGMWYIGGKDAELSLLPHFHSMTVELQKVGRPIPLFVNEIMPRLGHSVFAESNVLRYDLMKGEWMPPKGRGEVADVEFVLNPQEKLGLGTNAIGYVAMRTRDSVTMRFLGDGCGIVSVEPKEDSRLRVRTAPETGYEKECVSEHRVESDLQYFRSWKNDLCQCFRIRVKRNDAGDIVAANYGKIYGGIGLYFAGYPDRKAVDFSLRYYLNPTSMDRNLEYNTRKNLNRAERGKFRP